MVMLQVLNLDLYITTTTLSLVRVVLQYGKMAIYLVNSVASLSIPDQI